MKPSVLVAVVFLTSAASAQTPIVTLEPGNPLRPNMSPGFEEKVLGIQEKLEGYRTEATVAAIKKSMAAARQ